MPFPVSRFLFFPFRYLSYPMAIDEPADGGSNSWRSDGPFSSFASRATVLALAFFAGFVGVRVLTTEATTTTVSSKVFTTNVTSGAISEPPTCYSLHPPREGGDGKYCQGLRLRQQGEQPEVWRALMREARLALAAAPPGNASAPLRRLTAFCGERLPGKNPCYTVDGETRCLPAFMLIGFMKCGTTALFDYLARHPNVVGPSNKEPNWFVRLVPIFRCTFVCPSSSSHVYYFFLLPLF